MDDFGTDDMQPDDLAAMLKAVFGMPDPAAMRSHYREHLTDDLSIPGDQADILLIADEVGSSTPSPADLQADGPAGFARWAVAREIHRTLDTAFSGIHHAESMGVPLDAMFDLGEVQERAAFLVSVWEHVNASVTVEVPDDASALI